MIDNVITVQLTAKGMIPIPLELRQQLGLKPRQKVYLKRNNGYLLVMLSRQEVGQQIIALMKEGLSGLTQVEIDQERITNENRW